MNMGSRPIHLYVSGTTWLAGDIPPQPLRGEHASPLAQKWELVGEQLRKAGGGRRDVSAHRWNWTRGRTDRRRDGERAPDEQEAEILGDLEGSDGVHQLVVRHCG